jgi:hypothetical protein
VFNEFPKLDQTKLRPLVIALCRSAAAFKWTWEEIKTLRGGASKEGRNISILQRLIPLRSAAEVAAKYDSLYDSPSNSSLKREGGGGAFSPHKKGKTGSNKSTPAHTPPATSPVNVSEARGPPSSKASKSKKEPTWDSETPVEFDEVDLWGTAINEAGFIGCVAPTAEEMEGTKLDGHYIVRSIRTRNQIPSPLCDH